MCARGVGGGEGSSSQFFSRECSGRLIPSPRQRGRMSSCQNRSRGSCDGLKGGGREGGGEGGRQLVH